MNNDKATKKSVFIEHNMHHTTILVTKYMRDLLEREKGHDTMGPNGTKKEKNGICFLAFSGILFRTFQINGISPNTVPLNGTISFLMPPCLFPSLFKQSLP